MYVYIYIYHTWKPVSSTNLLQTMKYRSTSHQPTMYQSSTISSACLGPTGLVANFWATLQHLLFQGLSHWSLKIPHFPCKKTPYFRWLNQHFDMVNPSNLPTFWAGDAIFIPNGWWHAVEALGPGPAVSISGRGLTFCEGVAFLCLEKDGAGWGWVPGLVNVYSLRTGRSPS